MDAKQAYRKLREFAAGKPHSMDKDFFVLGSGKREVTCGMYVEGLGAVKGASWDEALKNIMAKAADA